MVVSVDKIFRNYQGCFFFRARGIYYLTTNAKKPYAQGFPGKKVPKNGDSRTAGLPRQFQRHQRFLF